MSISKNEARVLTFDQLEDRYRRGMVSQVEFEAYWIIWVTSAHRYGHTQPSVPLFDDVREKCEEWGYEVVCDDNAIPISVNDLG